MSLPLIIHIDEIFSLVLEQIILIEKKMLSMPLKIFLIMITQTEQWNWIFLSHGWLEARS